MLSYACWMCNLPNIIEVIHHVNYNFEAFAAQPLPYVIKKNKGADRIASPYSSAPMKDLGLERELQVKPYICRSVKVVQFLELSP